MSPIILKPQEGPQERFLATSADICIFGGSAGGGKAAPLSEPVLTPFGFRKMGDIKVGDLVTGADGKAERVIQIHPQGEMNVYRIKFIDGAETRCTAQHLWLSKEAHKSSKSDTRELGNWRVRDTKTLIEMLKKGKNVLIPMTKPVTYTVGRYGGKIKPYTLGVLLGDGCLSGSSITVTKNDDEIFENISRDGYDIAPVKTKNHVKTYIFHNFKEERRYLSLHKLRCTAKGKYIPKGYKYAPPEYRLALIQGLMDTDGYADNRGHCEYCTISPRLAKDMQELIWSIGGKATIREKIPTCVFPDGTRKICDKAYVVYIQTGDNAQLFRLKRKKNRCQGKKFNGGYSEMLRRIISIEPCGKEVCQCITVDSPDGLYVTKDYIVTHNSFALLLEPLRYMDVEGYKAVVFRQNYTQIMAAGGLWDESSKMYRLLSNAVATMSPKAHWTFGGKAVINFDYLARDDDVYKWQGSQICFIGFDELTHFSEKQFFYMLSRNRSTCGVKPYVRATCNPDADSWVAKFIAWWIDPDTGYPIKERSGVKRYFTRVDDTVIWGDTAEECAEKSGVDISLCKSVTFIASSIHDNKALLAADPSYLASLNALSLVERERLLNGNWKIKPAAGLYFPRSGIRIVNTIPDKLVTTVRAWDLAATEITTSNKDPDRTCGTLWGRMRNGQYIILDGIRVAKNAANVRDLIVSTAKQDKTMYGTSKIFIPQDPGQAGKDQSRSYAKILTGYSFMSNPVTGNKITRAEPMAAQWQNGNIYMLEGEWNKPYLDEMDGFPDLLHDDYVDSSSDGFRIVSNYSAWGGLTK